MRVIAITGSIGCGKTYLADMVKKMGYAVYDIDKWVRYLYYKPEFLEVIKKEFPQTFETGVFNKRALRNIVFADNKELKRLEALIHPFLKQKLRNVLSRHARSEDYIFLDVALLFEMHWDKYCDYIILADVDKEIQKQRVMNRDKITARDFEKIVAVQIDNNIKKRFVDIVIDTGRPDGRVKTELMNFIDNGII